MIRNRKKVKLKKAKSLTRVIKKIIIISALVLLIIVFRNYQDSSKFLSECTGHLKGNHHYHLEIEIKQDDKKIPIPPNVGINGECIHPLHTHDETGLVHIDYPRKIQVTLGDFFDVMGIIFKDDQVGNIKQYDGYNIEVFVNNKKIPGDYRNIILKDKEDIGIVIKASTH